MEIVAAQGIFRHKSAGLNVLGPCSCDGCLYARGACIDGEAFFTERALGGRRGWQSMAWHGWPELIPVLRARNLHDPVDFPSLLSFCSPELLRYLQIIPQD